MTVTLFDPGPGTPVEVLSADARRTAGQRAYLDAGMHPVTRGAARPDLGICGTCAHHVVHGHNRRRYHKCELRPVTSGPGTDIRLSWPACEKHVDIERLTKCVECGGFGWVPLSPAELAAAKGGVTAKRCTVCTGRGEVIA